MTESVLRAGLGLGTLPSSIPDTVWESVPRCSAVKVFESKAQTLLLLPLHLQGNHWALVALHRPTATVYYFDSGLSYLRNPGNVVQSVSASDSEGSVRAMCSLLAQFLQRVVSTRGRDRNHFLAVEQEQGRSGFIPDWTVVMVRPPQQTNGNDCGVHVCVSAVVVASADAESRSIADADLHDLTVPCKDQLRWRIATCINNQKLDAAWRSSSLATPVVADQG